MESYNDSFGNRSRNMVRTWSESRKTPPKKVTIQMFGCNQQCLRILVMIFILLSKNKTENHGKIKMHHISLSKKDYGKGAL